MWSYIFTFSAGGTIEVPSNAPLKGIRFSGSAGRPADTPTASSEAPTTQPPTTVTPAAPQTINEAASQAARKPQHIQPLFNFVNTCHAEIFLHIVLHVLHNVLFCTESHNIPKPVKLVLIEIQNCTIQGELRQNALHGDSSSIVRVRGICYSKQLVMRLNLNGNHSHCTFADCYRVLRIS
jgi:hypothetical protein